MPMNSEENFVTRPLQVSREPVGPKRAGDKGSPGDVALMDAVYLVAACWVFIFLLYASLHRHNV